MIGRTQLTEVEEHGENQPATDSSVRLADEIEIRRIVDEIDNAVDEKNWVRARTFFTDKVDTDFTSLAGGEAGQITADELVGGWRENLFENKKTFHQRTNHRIEIEGDKATVFSKGYAFNLIDKGKVKGLWEVWANYSHTLERANDNWKVSGMTLTVIHARGDDRVRTYQPNSK